MDYQTIAVLRDSPIQTACQVYEDTQPFRDLKPVLDLDDTLSRKTGAPDE